MALENWLMDLVVNLGVSYGDLIFIGIFLASLLFTAEEFRYGIFVMFIIQGFLLAVFINWGMPITKVLYLLFILLIVMTFTILKSRQGTPSGGF